MNISGKNDNFKLKNESTVSFLKFIVQHKLSHFNKFDRIKIIREYHYELNKMKTINSIDWLFLIKNYMININIPVIRGFLKKYI